MLRSIDLLASANTQSARRLATAYCWLMIGAVAATLAACTSSSSSGGAPSSADESSPITTGVFKDGNVAGLDFVSGQEMGVTDAKGQFTCETGEQVKFFIGNVELGETRCTTLAHPAALTASGSLSDPETLNITRFLLLLDDDQVPENGIVISDNLRTLAGSWAPIDFSVSDFEGQLAQVMSDIASVEGRTVVALPSNTDAFIHLDSSLSCAYSGVFVSTFTAGAYSARTTMAVAIYREPGSTTDSFLTEIVRVHPISSFYLQSSGTVELKTLPSLAGTPSHAGVINADYTSPDRLVGNWNGGISQQSSPIDLSGSFAAHRIGDSSGDYRFTGTFTQERDSRLGLQAASGYVVLTLGGTTISGEAYEAYNGFPSVVTGKRAPNSEQAELRVEQFGFEYSGTVSVTIDENGSPVSMEGHWPGLETSSFTAAACRL